MSAAPSEPEKYSIDAMMDRLKSPASEDPGDGELVTRSDGSQAVRVRKRKRRSSQSHKDESLRSRRSRIFKVSATLILLFVAFLAFGGAVIYANSSPFREGLVRMISESTGATPDLQTFRMNPQTANAGSLSLDWPEGNLLENFKLSGINAQISLSSFLGKSIAGEEVTFRDGNLTLHIPKSGATTRFTPPPSNDLPIHFKRYRLPKFNLIFADQNKTVLALYKSEASLTGESVSGLPQMRLFRGELVIAGWPKFRMDRALIEFRDDQIDIVGLRILDQTDDRGSFGFSGTIFPYKPDQVSNLTVSLDSFQISGLVGSAFGKLMSGRINTISSTTSNYFSFTPSENSSPTLDIAFDVTPSSRIEVRGFPFMFGISQLVEDGDDWFEAPVFDSEATGVLHKENGVITFRNLNLISKSRMAIRGDISLATNQSLSGNLRIGMATAMISKKSQLNPMFGPPQDGFRWIDLKISGSVNAPADNFKDLYEQSLKSKDTPAAAAGDGGSTFDELTRPR